LLYGNQCRRSPSRSVFDDSTRECRLNVDNDFIPCNFLSHPCVVIFSGPQGLYVVYI